MYTTKIVIEFANALLRFYAKKVVSPNHSCPISKLSIKILCSLKLFVSHQNIIYVNMQNWHYVCKLLFLLLIHRARVPNSLQQINHWAMHIMNCHDSLIVRYRTSSNRYKFRIGCLSSPCGIMWKIYKLINKLSGICWNTQAQHQTLYNGIICITFSECFFFFLHNFSFIIVSFFSLNCTFTLLGLVIIYVIHRWNCLWYRGRQIGWMVERTKPAAFNLTDQQAKRQKLRAIFPVLHKSAIAISHTNPSNQFFFRIYYILFYLQDRFFFFKLVFNQYAE